VLLAAICTPPLPIQAAWLAEPTLRDKPLAMVSRLSLPAWLIHTLLTAMAPVSVTSHPKKGQRLVAGDAALPT
jgi:hypothetical protein